VEVREILDNIDREIERLKTARALLAGAPSARRGKKAAPASGTGKKRTMSTEGRRRIAEAMKRRWAERKKTAAKSSR
jgi:hypothetical protein